MCQPNTLGAEEAGIYQSFLGQPNFFQKLLCKLVLLKFPTNFQINHKSPKTVENSNPSCVKMSPIKNQNLYTFKENFFYFFFWQICKICAKL